MLVLDTHALVWLVEDTGRRGRTFVNRANRALSRNELAVPSIVFWEVAMKAGAGRIELEVPPAQWRNAVLALGIRELVLTGDIAIAAASLANFHRDPADCIVVATTVVHNATLATADERILAWPGRLDRCDATN